MGAEYKAYERQCRKVSCGQCWSQTIQNGDISVGWHKEILCWLMCGAAAAIGWEIGKRLFH